MRSKRERKRKASTSLRQKGAKQTSSLGCAADSNALVLPEPASAAEGGIISPVDAEVQSHATLSKSQLRKLKQVEAAAHQRSLRNQLYGELAKHSLTQQQACLLQGSASRGAKATRKQELSRALKLERAGLPVDPQSGLHQQSNGSRAIHCASADAACQDPLGNGTCHQLQPGLAGPARDDTAATMLPEQEVATSDEGNDPDGSESSGADLAAVEPSSLKRRKLGEGSAQSSQLAERSSAAGAAASGLADVRTALKQSRAELGLLEDGGGPQRKLKSVKAAGLSGVTRVVHIQRPAPIEEARSQLPIIGQEQEIMEAIAQHSVIVLCGETGCGKTTQVPQFLLESGYGCSDFPERAGMIGVTQPRRLAAISSAQRVAAELGCKVGSAVGYQVRYDRQVGKDCAMKFMTDGILLREMQHDFLLRQYSIIIIDEAHERSLNSDILLGMLSRIVPLRQKMAGASVSGVQALRLVIMSATLRTEDFVANQRLFPQAPPLVHVPARQFPVTVHFNRRTELHDYVGAAFAKVCKIHRQLPPGGVLVFLSGQREVQELVARLRHTFPDKAAKAAQQPSSTSAAKKSHLAAEPVSTTQPDQIPEPLNAAEAGGAEDEHAGLTGGLDAAESSEHPSQVVQQTLEEVTWDGEGDDALVETDEEEDVIVLGDPALIAADADKEPGQVDKHEEDSNAPIQALPLYALLPAAAQSRVFQPAPPGHRQVIVATNVAETSLTIPGIRYVVDAGRAKQRLLEEGHTGMARFEVRWISKASAEQRAGRAGRTGPGHCYRLFSSAHYNDTFPRHTPPEILNTPLEGVVLLLKAMSVDKMENFPLPTSVEPGALAAAERCLVALAALHPDTRALTRLGTSMAALPISPRHARMIHQVVADAEAGRKGAQKALPYAIALAAALDAESPFIRPDSLAAEDGEAAQALRARRKRAHAAHAAFSSTAGDALSALRVLCAYEAASCSEQFCRDNFLHARNLREMGAARRQLARILSLNLASAAGRKSIAGQRSSAMLGQDALKQAASGSVSKDPSKSVLECLRRAVAAGWADQVARRVHATFIKPRAAGEAEEGRSSRAIRYRACCLEEDVYLHPSSGLAKTGPQWIAYTQLLRSGKRPYMGGATSIEAHWLPEVAAPLCTFSEPLLEPPPVWDKHQDSVLARHEVTYGGHAWPLPHHSRLHPDMRQRCATFAAALLDGRVFPVLAGLKAHWVMPPSMAAKPEGQGVGRIVELVAALQKAGCDSARRLAQAWHDNPAFLRSQMLMWLPKHSALLTESIWSSLMGESQQLLLSSRSL